MDGYTYRLLQRRKDGTLWRQPDEDVQAAQADNFPHIRQVVIAGYLPGQARWAETADSGMFLFGIDMFGKAHEGSSLAVPDFSERYE